jgi:hypothetical protein
MIPHPDTAFVISALDYQERLREAEKDRIAASAQTGGRSPLTPLRTARLLVASWLSGVVTRGPGAKQTPVSPPLSRIHTRPARPLGAASETT